ncbi:MAG: HEAT repeat domain-containing protein [Anaerolineae bacterium]
MRKSPGSVLARIHKALHRLWRFSVQRWAIWRDRADTTSEATCMAQLTAAEPSRRWRAAAGLGRNPLRSPQAIAALIRALADPEPIVRWHAAEALAAQEAGHAFPALVAALADPEPLRRAGAAEALGGLGGEAATLALRPHLSDADPGVRAAVAAALGRIGDPTVVTDLLPLLDDADPDVVRAAAAALGRLGSTAATMPLAQALVRPGQPLLVRRALAAALMHVPHPNAQPQLLAVLTDPDPQVRAYAAQALGQVGSEAAHAPLKFLRADRNRLLRGTVGDWAGHALALLERRGRRSFATEHSGGEDEWHH